MLRSLPGENEGILGAGSESVVLSLSGNWWWLALDVARLMPSEVARARMEDETVAVMLGVSIWVMRIRH